MFIAFTSTNELVEEVRVSNCLQFDVFASGAS